MSDEIAIKVENLTKIYKLYDAPQDRLKESLHPLRKKYHHDFYALNDMSFTIKKGETVGIVGRNGCGKSTLLKVITGVLTPTSGAVTVNGKVSALLELGAGFNPDLTGMENVYFNGALLGYSRDEMDDMLGDILSFADIGQFIHQPVKTYSSGMFVRLAFAVAINVDPDILIVDEALSVGDEAFQRKCFSRIMDFQKRGKTMLFVSHSASAIVELCDKALLFDGGELLLQGAPKPIVTHYQKLVYAPVEKLDVLREEIRALDTFVKEHLQDASGDKTPSVPNDELSVEGSSKRLAAFYDPTLLPQSTVVYESQGAVINDPHITSLAGEKVNTLLRGEEYVYTYMVHFEQDSYNVRFGMLVKTVSGLELGGLVSQPITKAISFIAKGTIKRVAFTFRCTMLPGTYFLNAGVVGTVADTETFLYRLIDAFMFRVQPEEHLTCTGLVDISASTKADASTQTT